MSDKPKEQEAQVEKTSADPDEPHPQPLTDEQTYKDIAPSEPRVTHKAQTQEEEEKAAKEGEQKPQQEDKSKQDAKQEDREKRPGAAANKSGTF